MNLTVEVGSVVKQSTVVIGVGDSRYFSIVVFDVFKVLLPISKPYGRLLFVLYLYYSILMNIFRE